MNVDRMGQTVVCADFSEYKSDKAQHWFKVDSRWSADSLPKRWSTDSGLLRVSVTWSLPKGMVLRYVNSSAESHARLGKARLLVFTGCHFCWA